MSGHEDYFALPALNWSLLRNAATSLLHFHHAETTPRADTGPMLLGRAVHCAVLEPDAFPLQFVVWDGYRRGKDWEAFQTANAGRDILTRAEYDKCLGIKDAVYRDKDARKLLRSGSREKTYIWTDPATRLRCKCRADLVKRDCVWDLKTTKSVTEHDFSRTIATYLYHGQAGFYTAGTKRPHFGFIAVESEPPFDVGVLPLDDDSLWVGEEIVKDLLAKVKEARRTKRWPGQWDGMHTIGLPGYAFPEDDTKKLEGLA